jgi:hypothetical protein
MDDEGFISDALLAGALLVPIAFLFGLLYAMVAQ